MGWWRAEDGESVVGDGPVDLVIEAWHDIVSGRAERVEAPPVPSVLRHRSGFDADERARIEEALDAVGVEYRQSELDRDPTDREIAETIDFAVVELEAAEPPESSGEPDEPEASGPTADPEGPS